jgi:hypothetical protein
MTIQPLPMPPRTAQPKLPVLKALTCPKCGASLSQFTPSAQTIICQSCRSHVALGGEALSILSAGQHLPAPPMPIQLGQTLKLAEGTFFVLGRVLYEGRDDEDTWRWTEWLLGAGDGRLLWLSYFRKEGFVLFRKMRLREPLGKRTIPIGEGRTAPINERYPARIIGAEGELTFRAAAGDKLTMIEGAAGGKKYSVQQTLSEIEAYEGTPISSRAIAEALGDAEWLKRLEIGNNRAELLSAIGLFALVFAALALLMFAVTSNSGQLIDRRTLALSTAQREARFPIQLVANGRPIQISLRLRSDLPKDTFANVEVSVIAPNEVETFIFEKDFYHETGYDEDGYWSERDSFGSAAFTVEQSGQHEIELNFSEGSPSITGVTVEVSLRRNVILSTPFLIYAIGVGALGVALMIAGAVFKQK